MELAENVVVAERFRLNRLIGQGGMGSVWLATHVGLDTPCAIKFIEGAFATHPEAQARFAREAKAAALLRSPHVVQILDHGVHDGTPYIAMELLEGEDLAARIARKKRLPPHEVLWIVEHVCRALSKAHAVGIVHRDLKPENVFLVRDDDREIAKVLDFGIAKHTGSLDGSKTKTGALLGTPLYMSPEQARGTGAVDGRSDLWSVGVIVYHALTGKLPFESDAFGDLLMQIMTNPLPIPSRVAAVPPGFDAWWLKAAARDPADRFQSARELFEALAHVLVPSARVPVDRMSEPSLGGPVSEGAPDPPPSARSDVAMTAAPFTAEAKVDSKPRIPRAAFVVGVALAMTVVGFVSVLGLARRSPTTVASSAEPAVSESPPPPPPVVFDEAPPAAPAAPPETDEPKAAVSASATAPMPARPTAVATPRPTKRPASPDDTDILLHRK